MIIKNQKIPCENCITLSICKAAYESEKSLSAVYCVSKVANKCSILRDYIIANRGYIVNWKCARVKRYFEKVGSR